MWQPLLKLKHSQPTNQLTNPLQGSARRGRDDIDCSFAHIHEIECCRGWLSRKRRGVFYLFMYVWATTLRPRTICDFRATLLTLCGMQGFYYVE